ncbi:MAG: hypothetical protein ACTHU0_01160 [Kofleriaceae bacterium]
MNRSALVLGLGLAIAGCKSGEDKAVEADRKVDQLKEKAKHAAERIQQRAEDLRHRAEQVVDDARHRAAQPLDDLDALRKQLALIDERIAEASRRFIDEPNEQVRARGKAVLDRLQAQKQQLEAQIQRLRERLAPAR